MDCYQWREGNFVYFVHESYVEAVKEAVTKLDSATSVQEQAVKDSVSAYKVWNEARKNTCKKNL